MADLRRVLSDLGYSDVSTYLQSGNAVFTASASRRTMARKIQQAVLSELGVPTEVIIRSGSEMAAVVRDNPLVEVSTNPSRLFVTFLADGVDVGQLSDVDPTAYEPERFAFGDGVVYVWLPDGAQNSRLTQSFWERRLRGTATTRNWNTVTKLAEMSA